MAAIQCPQCGAKLNVPEAALGKTGRCPKCQTKFLVQLPPPVDAYALAPLDAPALFAPPPGSLDPLAQPQPSAARSLGPATSLPTPPAVAPPVVDGPNKQQVALLVGGGLATLFVLLLVVGGLVVAFSQNGNGKGNGKPAGGGASMVGDYAVVDSFPSPPAEAEGPAPPLDTEPSLQAAWSVKPDPPAGEEASAGALVGALSPEQSLLLASLSGPYAVGVTPQPETGQRTTTDSAPHPVLDVRTGKPAGQFPAEARVRFDCRLSPDGRYLASSAFLVQGTYTPMVVKDEIVVWQRDAEQPTCRWPLPGPVLWADFIAPDRLALYHITPSPQFVVLDVAKGEPVLTTPLPPEEFPNEHDAFSKRKNFTSYRVWTSSGAVSPGRNLIALGGNKHILLVNSAGQVAGKLPVDSVNGVRGYLGVSFKDDGTQLRALTQQGEATAVLRVWSLTQGKPLYKKPCPFQLREGENAYQGSAPGLAILDGPEPNALLIGHLLFDLASDRKIAELPYQPLRWAGPQRLLALGRTEQAANAKELAGTADFVPPGKSLIVAAFDGAALLASAPQPPADPRARPTPTPADRSQLTASRLTPPAAWSVKPGAPAPRPAGPLPQWPHAFAASEAAVISESLVWTRYDLNTGSTLGEPISLWPGQPRPSEPAGWPTAALTRDGQRLALVDAKDRGRVDVWDNTGNRLIGLRPYDDDPILWLGWSADGKLLTADSKRLSGWEVHSGQAAYEIESKYQSFAAAPGAEWVLVMTPARHLFFVDSATGQAVGHLPASPSFPEHAFSPDGTTLLRFNQKNLQVWDLTSGKRKSDRETPLVPLLPGSGVFWLGPRSILSQTTRPGEQQPRYYLYDLDQHTHTYSYAAGLGVFQNDALGRAWMNSQPARSKTWSAPQIPGGGVFEKTLAFGPGKTVRVEANIGTRERSQKTAENMASSLAALGFKVGRDGWILRADHTTSTTLTDLSDLKGQRGISVAKLNITWRLLDPEGNEAWKGTSGGKFDPFTSKYVVLGSRKTEMAAGGLGGGSTEVKLDYQGKDAMTAQVDEIWEKYWYPAVPTCLVKNDQGYSALPLAGPEPGMP